MDYVVSDEHEFIYFVVPKAACTSIKHALLPLFDLDTTGYLRTQTDGTTHLQIHKLFYESGYLMSRRELIAELNGKYRDYFKFAFVRNPWDRLVSCYCEKLTGAHAFGLGSPARTDIALYKGMPFAEFVEAVYEIPDDEADVHFRSQHKIICGPEGDKPIMADFIGRFENLAADFSVVAERIGGNQNLQLPYKHGSKARNSHLYSDYYDDRLKNLVYKRYQVDAELFGYLYS
jgi:chondroitin 4-sulfotransferase 11